MQKIWTLKERLSKLSLAIAADVQPMVAVPKAAAAAEKAPAKVKAKPADDDDFDLLDIDDAPKKAAPKPKAAKEGGAAVAKAAPKKAATKAKAKEDSPVAARDKPARARKLVTYKLGDSDDDIEDDDDSFQVDDSDDDFEQASGGHAAEVNDAARRSEHDDFAQPLKELQQINLFTKQMHFCPAASTCDDVLV